MMKLKIKSSIIPDNLGNIIIVDKNLDLSSKERVFTMISYNTLTHNLKRGILDFSEKISKELTRPEFKFASQMLYGILTGQSCHLGQMYSS